MALGCQKTGPQTPNPSPLGWLQLSHEMGSGLGALRRGVQDPGQERSQNLEEVTGDTHAFIHKRKTHYHEEDNRLQINP